MERCDGESKDPEKPSRIRGLRAWPGPPRTTFTLAAIQRLVLRFSKSERVVVRARPRRRRDRSGGRRRWTAARRRAERTSAARAARAGAQDSAGVCSREAALK